VFSIRTMNKISAKGLDLFSPDTYSVGDEEENCDAIVVRSAKLHDLEFPDTLKAIARAGAGVNNIPIDRCSSEGVVVFNTPGANANSVKELVIAGLMLSARQVHQGLSWTRENAKNPDLAALVEKEKNRFAGTEIMGKTLGVVGLGAIGVMVSNAAVALGMRVIGFDPYISVESAWGLSQFIERAESLDGLLGQADYVTIHVPLSDSTKGMINAEAIGQMKSGARLLNFARGGLVDNSAVKDALDSGALSCYITDFPDAEVADHPLVLGVPHLGASTEEAEENCAIMAVKQLKDFLEHGTIHNSVNFPDCHLRNAGRRRILIANRNIPNMVGQITTILAQHSINILDLLNRHRGDLAYNIIDIDGDISDDVVAQLGRVDGVIFARTIPPQA